MTADQARHSRRARTRLDLAVGYLQAASSLARQAGMARQAATLDRLVRESTDLLQRWPVRERAERAL